MREKVGRSRAGTRKRCRTNAQHQRLGWTTCTPGEEEERGAPIVATKGSQTKTIVAKVAPSKGVENYAVDGDFEERQ